MSDGRSRPRALVLALNALTHDRRVLNEARSLAEAGFEVIRVGLVVVEGQPEQETTDFDTIIRLKPSWYKPLPAGAAGRAHDDSGARIQGVLRQWPLKVRAMNFVRDTFPRTMQGLDGLRGVHRWSKELVALCAGLRPDVVIACDFDTLSAGAALRRRGASFLVYDAHELWVDQSGRRFTRLVRRLALFLESRFARQADLCTTVGNGLADTLAKRHRIPRPLVVFNGPETVMDPAPHAVGPLRLYFQGSYSPGRGIERALAAMESLRGQATLTLQGFGVLEDELRSVAEERGLVPDPVTFVPSCRPDEVTQAASAYDIGLVSVEPVCLNNILSMPNKVFTYLGGGLAIMTTDETPEIAALVREYGCGIVADKWTADAIVEALRPLLGDRERVESMRAASRRACDVFAWERQFGPVVEALRERFGQRLDAP